jgi:two-component system chemotaxis sensor kinase CheA
MDDLLEEFLTETSEHLETVDQELVRFEQDPSNQDILRNVFRLVHTIKGTCGFIGLARLERLAHAAETVLGQLRDGAPVTPEAVTLILRTIDRVKDILTALAQAGQEPNGADDDLIEPLLDLAGRLESGSEPERDNVGTLAFQVLERPLKPGEVSLDERSEERRVGKECRRLCRSRWSPYH